MKINSLNNKFNYKNKLKLKKTKKYFMLIGMTLTMSMASNVHAEEDEKTDETNTNYYNYLVTDFNEYLLNKYKNNEMIFPFINRNSSPFENNNALLVPETDINNIEETTTNVEEEKIEKKLVAITFDDGPGKYTDRLLDILEDNDLKATFFVLGTGVENYGEVIQRAYEDGHEIAIHGYSHTSFTKMSIDEIQNEITTVENLLLDLNVTPSNLVRPPYGSINSDIKSNLDYSFILWSVDTEDWKSRDKDAVIEEIKANIEEGSIILLHDIHSTTIDAMEEILPELVDEYEFVTVDELFQRNEQELEQNESYRKVKVLEKIDE